MGTEVLTPPAPTAVAEEQSSRSLWKAFRSAPGGLAALIVCGLLVVVAVVAPFAFGDRAQELDVSNAYLGSTAEHWLGTDGLGRDIMYRLLVATRISVGLAVLAAFAGATLGLVLGLLTVVLPRPLRVVAQRTMDTLQAFPTILLAILIGAMLGPGTLGILLGVGTALGFRFARVVSTLALSVGARDYVLAARVLGVRRTRLLTRHVVPNMAETLLIASTVSIGASIVAIASLSFLGLGIQPPQYDWGGILQEGTELFYEQPVQALAAGGCIALAALAFGFTGEALARAMNPLLWTSLQEKPRRRLFRADRPVDIVVADEAPKRTPDADRTSESGKGLLRVKDLRITLPGSRGPVTIVRDVSFAVSPGEMVGIVGESGSGKTMTVMAVAQLLPAGAEVDGTIEFDDKDLVKLRRNDLKKLLASQVAVVFQDPMSSLNPALRIKTQLTEGPVTHGRFTRQEASERAAQTLTEVNIPRPERVLGQHPHELSGGMRQRVMIALGLMNDPKLLIADEPTTAVDVTVQAQVMDVIADVNETRGTAVVLISHNLGLVAQNCTRIMVMYAGRIVEDAPTEAILEQPLHPYTRALMQAVPDLGRPLDEALRTIPGDSPDPARLPTGCAFHPRCPLATDLCRESDPSLVRHDGGRRAACWAAEGRI